MNKRSETKAKEDTKARSQLWGWLRRIDKWENRWWMLFACSFLYSAELYIWVGLPNSNSFAVPFLLFVGVITFSNLLIGGFIQVVLYLITAILGNRADIERISILTLGAIVAFIVFIALTILWLYDLLLNS
jgi:hypothetical protein